ncbi:MAG: hypothetical protein IPP31_06690 [Chitinophagaceae bacterium]|nr:hypothetical protein [Chitinophagaceae bacterium]
MKRPIQTISLLAIGLILSSGAFAQQAAQQKKPELSNVKISTDDQPENINPSPKIVASPNVMKLAQTQKEIVPGGNMVPVSTTDLKMPVRGVQSEEPVRPVVIFPVAKPAKPTEQKTTPSQPSRVQVASVN